MSRFRRFAHNVGSGYVALGANIIYSFASVPLALHYLSRQDFGLWALLMQLVGYLGLIDLGMNGAATRLLIDHKDNPETGDYGSMVQTTVLVSLVQALIVAGAGLAFATICARLVSIPAARAADFTMLLRWQILLTAFGFATRLFGQLLGAHQRMDIANYGQTFQLLAGLGFLWWFFSHGAGIFGLLYSSALGTLLCTALLAIMCQVLGLFPPRKFLGAPSWRVFKEVFGYGKDVFLVAFGGQLIMESATIILARRLGLEKVAAWAVGTRMFTLVCQVIWRISDSAMAPFAEMMARREHERLFRRYKEMVIASCAIAGVGATIFAACNSLFIHVWTLGRIEWAPHNDLLLAIWIILLTLVHCHCGFVLITKQIGWMRYIYLLEGIVFIASALVAVRFFGIAGILIASLVSGLGLSGTYGILRIARYFERSPMEVGLEWLVPMAKVLAILAPVTLLLWFLTLPLSPLIRLILLGIIPSLLGSFLLIRFVLTAEMFSHFPIRLQSPLRPFVSFKVS